MAIDQTQVFHGSGEERGSWPTSRSLVLALLPLVAIVGLAVAVAQRVALPLTDAQVVWLVIGPLVLADPVIAAIARVKAYAPTTVLVVASVAPAIALAARLLLEPLERTADGRAVIDAAVLQERALPPGIVAVALYVAIEIATFGMRRGIVMGIVASLFAIAVVGVAAAGLLQLTGTTLPTLR